jgi:hypothetical protein
MVPVRAQNPSSLLKQLENLKDSYGPAAAESKRALLESFERVRFKRPKELLRFHEALCFLRAYPDNRDVLAKVERLLSRFAQRADLRQHRRVLADSGIAGTAIHFPFFWFTARWLARRWPGRLTIEWGKFEQEMKLKDILHLLLPYSETPAVDELTFSPREWIHLLRGPHETDAEFLIRRFQALRTDSFGRETIYEGLDIPLRLEPGPDTPSRTHARYAPATVFFQRRPLVRAVLSLRHDVRRPPLAVRAVPPREAQKLIDLAREAMVTRSRDLDIFENGDPNDVRLVDCGEGLQFVCIGAVPERRLMLEAVYAFLTLKNGVPTGYVLASALFGSSEVAYNVFETFRGAESAYIFGRVIAMVRHLFGSDTFTIDTYQLGQDNEEGLKSGAWWFYYRRGFRPRDPAVRRVLRVELKRLLRNPRHRSSIATLKKLAAENVFFYLGRPRPGVLGRVLLGNIGLGIARYCAERFGADREAGLRACSQEAARLLGVGSLRGWSGGQRLWWKRWSPLVLALPGVTRWSQAERRALARVICAKGSPRESDFVGLFNRHRRLRQALLQLAAGR